MSEEPGSTNALDGVFLDMSAEPALWGHLRPWAEIAVNPRRLSFRKNPWSGRGGRGHLCGFHQWPSWEDLGREDT
jgi:hypothetical protein